MEVDQLIGEILDHKYRINKLIGAGGMGSVFFATHLGTGRPVALKVIAPKFMAREEFVQRFKREAKAAGLLRHPSIVDVTDFGFTNLGDLRIAYLVMEYLEGFPLSEVLLKERELSLNWAIGILEQVCFAVEKAHKQGVIHRDLKPDNIWLEPNDKGGFNVKVLDFGLAHLEDSKTSAIEDDQLAITTLAAGSYEEIPEQQSAAGKTLNLTRENITTQEINVITEPEFRDEKKLTRAGALLGTPAYMSPEQASGKPVTKQSDIYSLGVIAYEMTAGQRPFRGEVRELLKEHKEATPPPIRSLRKKVPKQVDEVIRSALAKNPDARPGSALSFASMLRAGSEGAGVLLRRSFALYSEYFPKLIWASFLVSLPSLLLTILHTAITILILNGSISWKAGVITNWLFILAQGALIFIFSTILSAAVVRLVMQYITYPQKPISLRQAFDSVRRRIGPILWTTQLIALLIIFGLVLGVIPGLIFLVLYSLTTQVIMMESMSDWAAMRRAKALAKRSLKIVIYITLIQYGFPFVGSFIVGSFYWYLDPSLSQRLGELMRLPFMVFTNPLVAIMSALLYLKVLDAGGESSRDVLLQFEMEQDNINDRRP